MTPSLFHAPPRPFTALHNASAGPPLPLIFFTLPCAKNPISRLSADQNGYVASSVPANGFAVIDDRERTYNRTFPFSSRAVNASRVPSGEITAGPDDGTTATNEAPAGGRIDDFMTALGREANLTYAPVEITAIRTATAATAHQTHGRLPATIAGAFSVRPAAIHFNCSFTSCAV